ncbi:MAG: Lrp/AsnC ligand binding domain-containing protein [Candidatus Hermodarchaeota archaeon]
MPMAFVLINTELGKENTVIDSLKKISGVLDVSMLYGAYDLIVKVEETTMPSLKELVHSKIRKLEDVNTSLTMIVIEGSDVI